MAKDKTMIIAEAASTIFYDGTDVGYTLGGVELTQDITKFDVTADQSNTALQQTLQEKIWRVKVPMTEMSIENMAIAFTVDTPNINGSTRIVFDSTDDPAVKTLGFVTTNLNNDTIRIFFHEVQVESMDSITFNKAAQAVMNVTFRCFDAASTNLPGYAYRQTS